MISKITNASLLIIAITLLVLGFVAFFTLRTALSFPLVKSVNNQGLVEPNHQLIEIERFDLVPCRDQNERQIDRSWVMFQLKNDNPDYWVQGKGAIKFFDENDELIGAFLFENPSGILEDPFAIYDFVLPANNVSWFTAPEILKQRRMIYVIAEDVATAVFEPSYLDWHPRDGSEKEYSWDVDIIEAQITDEKYPRHSLLVRLTNTGKATMYQTKIIAAIYNSEDQLLDIAWSGTPGNWNTGLKIKQGETKEVLIESIAQTGVCLGKSDPNGFKVRYWIDTMTYTDQPLTQLYEKTFIPFSLKNDS